MVSEDIYRCSECGRDLVDVDDDDDDDDRAAALAMTDGSGYTTADSDSCNCAVCGKDLTDPKNSGDPDINGDWVCSETYCRAVHGPSMTVERTVARTQAGTGQDDIRTDGGHPPGPSVKAGDNPTPTEFSEDMAFLGPDRHLCEPCGRVFEDVRKLAEHNCRLLTDGGIQASSSDPGIRGFVCGGCRQQCDGLPEFIDEDSWEPYCSRDCYEFEPEPGCPHVAPGELPCSACFFERGGHNG